MVRSWRQGVIDGGVGASTVAKAYRLLRAVLNTAFVSLGMGTIHPERTEDTVRSTPM